MANLPPRVRHATKLQRVTLIQVAAACNLPLMTVSRAIRGKTKEVNERDLKLAVETARRLGYRTNLMNRALRTGRRQLIGIVIPTLDANAYDVLSGIHDTCVIAEALCCVRQVPLKADRTTYLAAIHELSDRQVDGLVIVLPRELTTLADELQELCASRALPVVLIGNAGNPAVPGSGAWVEVDLESGIPSLISRLMSAGARSLALFSAVEQSPRYQPLVDCFEAAGAAAKFQVISHEIGRQIPTRAQLPTLIGDASTTAVLTTIPALVPALGAVLADRSAPLPLVVLANPSELVGDDWPVLLWNPNAMACGQAAATLLIDMAYQQGLPRQIRHHALLNGSPIG